MYACVCVSACAHVCVFVCVHACVWCVCTCVSAYVPCTCVSVCMCLCICLHMYICVHMCEHVWYVSAYVCVNVYVCVTVHAHECARVLACLHAFRSQNRTLLSSLITPCLTALRQGLLLHRSPPFQLGCLRHEVLGSIHPTTCVTGICSHAWLATWVPRTWTQVLMLTC